MNRDLTAGVLAAGGALATGSGLAAMGAREARVRARNWRRMRLSFGRDVSPEAVVSVLDRVAGLRRGVCVVLDVVADEHGIHHEVSTDVGTMASITGSLRSLLPTARLEPVEETEAPSFVTGCRIRLSGRLGVLRSDGPSEVSASLLAALQPLYRGERVVLRWWLGPGQAAMAPHVRDGQLIEPDERRHLRDKNRGSILRGSAVLVVDATNRARAGHLIGRVMAVLRTRSTPYGRLTGSPRHGRLLSFGFHRRTLPLLAQRFSSSELAGVIGWPMSDVALPGVTLGTSPQLMPATRIPRLGRVMGTATWPGMERPIAQPLRGALSHSLIVGPTGSGKSTLLTNLVASDIASGRGTVLVDGKGDTVSALLERIPAGRERDVIVLDCASEGPQPGLKLFGAGDPELAADVVLGVLSDLFRDSWGPLSERYLRAGLIAIAHDPDGTIADLPFVFTDPAYRGRLVGRLRDPLSRATFAAFEAMSTAERQNQLAAPLGKLGSLLGRPVVRTVLGQTKPALDFRDVLRRNQIVLVSLAPARVGAPAARLVGALVVFALFQSVQARSSLPESRRRPFLVSIDEPRALGDLPMPLDALLEQARGLGVGITLAPQSLAQLTKSVREAVLTNVATRVVFRQDAEDARLLARDLRGVNVEDLGDLAVYEAVARIGLGPGDLAPPVTLRTSAAAATCSDAEVIRRLSAETFGVTLDEVDAVLARRHEQPVTSAPVGRTRRTV